MMLLTEGQMSDHKGAFLLLAALPDAKELLGDKGYDSDWFRQTLIERGITPCIPPRSNRKIQGRVRQGGVISAVAVGHRQAALAVMCRG